MKEYEVNKLLTLLIINKVQSFRNSYDLTKVLAWKFGIIEFVDLIDSLLQSELIAKVVINGLSHYNMTLKGVDYLKANEETLRLEIYKLYPLQIEFIDSLWQRDDVGVVNNG